MNRRPFRRIDLVLALASLLVSAMNSGAQTPANWLGGTANWNTPANWSGGVIPNNGVPMGSTYDAFLNVAGTYTVTMNTPITLTNLTLGNASATLQVSNTSLTLANSAILNAGVIQLSSATVTGGTITSAGGRLKPDFSTSVLNGVSLGLNVLDMTGGRIALTNGTNFTGGPGTITLGGSSQLFIAEAATIPSGTIFALGSNASVSADGGFTAILDAANTDTVTVNVVGTNAALGGGFQNSAANSILINRGRVQFDPATVGGSLNIASLGVGSRFRNEGKLVASSAGGTNSINLSGGSYINAGTLVAAAGGIINLNGTFTRSDLGTFTNTGGTINLAGTLNNTSLDLDNTTGSVNLVGGTIVGGTVSAAGTARLRPNFTTSTLNGVSLGVNVLDMSAGRIALTNGTNFTGGPGTITLGASSQIFISEAATIASGTMFALGSNASVSADGGFTVTLDAATTDTVTINVLGINAGLGGGFQSNSPNSILINKGRVQFGPATVGGSLNIATIGAGSLFRNEGKLVASSSGAANTINLAGGSYTNAGAIEAATGGVINLNGTVTRLDLGTFTNTGGTINLNGTLNNTSLVLDNTTGTLNMAAGTIVGGTVSAAGTARLRPNFSTSTLSGVSLGLNVLDMSAGRVALTNGTNFTGAPGTITFGNSSQIYVAEAATIASGTVFALGPNASVSADGGFTVTLDAATTDTVTVNVLAGNAAVGGGFQSSTANSILINKGRIQFDPATVGGSLSISAQGAGSRFRNEGKLVASSSGSANTINLNPPYTNAGTLIAATGGVINLNGTFTRADLGTFTNTGGTINLTGTLNNTALDLDNTTGSINLVSGTIIGGTVSATGTARLKPSFSTSTLNGVSLGLNVLDMSAGRVAMTNGTNFTGAPGTITLGNSSQIYVAEAASIGSGTIFALGPNASVSADGGFTVTLDAATTDTVTINVLANNAAIGGGFQNGAANSILINKGRIQFDPATVGGSMFISSQGTGSRFRNEGKVVASSSGNVNTISLTTFTNAGTLIAATGGVINLNGTFSRADLGAFMNTGGSINIVGTLNNTTLDLDNTTGSIKLTQGSIVGGAVTATGTARLLADATSSNTLNGVALAFDVMDLTPVGSRIRFTGGTTLTGAGTIPLGNGSAVYLFQSNPVPSGINFAMGTGSSLSAEGVTATLAASNPNVLNARVAAGASVSIGSGLLSGGANSVLINQGTIDFAGNNSAIAILSGGTGSRVQNDGVLTVNTVGSNINIGGTTTFTNNGTLSAIGGTVNIPDSATFTNFNAGTLTGGTYQVFSSSVINLNARVITTVAANTTVLLDGASSVFTAANTVTTNNGSFTISNGRQHNVATFTNNGVLQVGTASGDLARLSANVQVNNGGVLRGTGTIEGPLAVASGGTLAPGASPGILTVIGPVTLNPGATFSVEIAGPNAGAGGYSQLNLAGSGTINLNNATFSSTLSYALAITDVLTIVTGGAVTGTFNGLPNMSLVDLGTFGGNAYKATIVYDATQVRLISPVPEPAAILLACGGVGAAVAGFRRWKRRR